LIELIQDAIALDQRRETLADDDFLQQAWAMEDRLLNWLQEKPSSPSSDLERLANHIAAHIAEWFAFLFHPAAPPTNNHAERMLRPAVITRKVGGCNKTLLGALVHSVLSSIMVTCKQQGQKFLDLARRLWSEPEAGPIPIPSNATSLLISHSSRGCTTLNYPCSGRVPLLFLPSAIGIYSSQAALRA
jgi:transposase